MYEKKHIIQTNPFERKHSKENNVRNVYWGEVISINDETDGGRIKVRIPDLDNNVLNKNLEWCYPLMPKFIHIFPKPGEVVRIIIEDIKYPERSRFWIGSIISQLQNIDFDPLYTALSTTNIALVAPNRAESTYPEAKGVYPNKEDIAVIGRNNTDIILRENDLELRAGKHELNDSLKLNKKNPASVRLTFLQETGNTIISNTIITSDRIGLISHEGNPKFKFGQLTSKDINRIFDEGHPMTRGDVLVRVLEIFRKAIIEHIHAYDRLPSDKSKIIIDLENLNLEQVLQKNIVIN